MMSTCRKKNKLKNCKKKYDSECAKTHHFKNQNKNFSGEQHSTSPDTSPSREKDTTSPTPPLQRMNPCTSAPRPQLQHISTFIFSTTPLNASAFPRQPSFPLQWSAGWIKLLQCNRISRWRHTAKQLNNWASAPRPHWGAYNTPPDEPIAGEEGLQRSSY